MTSDDLLSTVEELFSARDLPKPFNLLRALAVMKSGTDLKAAARQVRTTSAAVSKVAASQDPIFEIFRVHVDEITADAKRRAKQILGNLLLGRCAEIAFENIYREEMRTHELHLQDVRESRNDTDYRVINGHGRKVYRLNIKFHGSPFRRAAEFVGLQPDDCFALATYKINSAQEKQAEEKLPYIFTIVGVKGLTGEGVGERIPIAYVDLVALIHESPKTTGKRDIEDLIVEHLVETQHSVFTETYEQVRRADWYILSANKAIKLVREKLFERIFALKIRNFARVFGRAELDMHFSLSQDLTPLPVFLKTLRQEGPTKVAAILTNGDY